MFGWGKRRDGVAPSTSSENNSALTNSILVTMERLFTDYKLSRPTDEDKFNTMLSLNVATYASCSDVPEIAPDAFNVLRGMSVELSRLAGKLTVKLFLVVKEKDELGAIIKQLPANAFNDMQVNKNIGISGGLIYSALLIHRLNPGIEKIYTNYHPHLDNFDVSCANFVQETVLGSSLVDKPNGSYWAVGDHMHCVNSIILGI
jgi:hypothetical protein